MKPSILRIRHAPEMEALGIAGLVGECMGWSVPSRSGVEVSGPAPEDFVVHVHVDEREEGYWVAPEFVELVELVEGAKLDESPSAAELEGVPPAPAPAPAMPAPKPRLRPPTPRVPGRAGRAEANFIGRLLDWLWPD